MHISLSGEEIYQIGNFVITNTLLTTWVVMAILFGLSFFVSVSLNRIPGRFQTFIEFVIGGLYSTFESILGKNVKKFFPVLATMFLFIIASNWFGLIPGVGPAIGIVHEEEVVPHEEVVPIESAEHTPVDEYGMAETAPVEQEVEEEHAPALTPLFRAPTADLNTTIALALVAFVIIQVAGLQALGISYMQKFFNTSGGLPFYVSILELISEIGKIISFAFRLYGNIFAGEVLIGVIAFLIPYVATVPFLGLEIFVGFIQALVFSMLTTVFLSVAMIHEEH
jgi:F-type H+-transporting ATPase subunit a